MLTADTCHRAQLQADHSPQDRWGGTPLDDALRQGHQEVTSYLTGKSAKRGSSKKTKSGKLKSALKKGDGASRVSGTPATREVNGGSKKVSIGSAVSARSMNDIGSKSDTNGSESDDRHLNA